MSDKILSIVRWIFPRRHSLYASCTLCRSVRKKSEMLHTLDGNFCNKDEAQEYWQLRQW